MGSGHLKPTFSLRLNSIPSPDFSVCWDSLGIKMLTGDEYSTIRGVARIFPEVRTIFQIPPRHKFDRQKHSHWHNRALLCLLRGQAWVKITCSCFIPSCLLSVCIFKYIIKIKNKNQLNLENRFSGVEKTSSPLFQEKYSKELNRVKRNLGNL